MGNEAHRLIDGVNNTSTLMLDWIKINTASALISWNLSVSLILEPESFCCAVRISIRVGLSVIRVQWIWDMLTLSSSVSNIVHSAFIVGFSTRAISSCSDCLVIFSIETLRILLSSGVCNFLSKKTPILGTMSAIIMWAPKLVIR